MNHGCWPQKTRRLAANLSSRRRIISALWRRHSSIIEVAKYQTALVQRYPIGLVSEAEVEALLDSWLRG